MFFVRIRFYPDPDRINLKGIIEATYLTGVGSELFVTAMDETLGVKGEGRAVIGSDGSYELRESPAAYKAILGYENAALRPENKYFGKILFQINMIDRNGLDPPSSEDYVCKTGHGPGSDQREIWREFSGRLEYAQWCTHTSHCGFLC